MKVTTEEQETRDPIIGWVIDYTLKPTIKIYTCSIWLQMDTLLFRYC